MIIAFDPAKDLINREKHGISLLAAEFADWDNAWEWQDTRKDYGENRRVALAMIGERLYTIVYVERDGCKRIISLRKSNDREWRFYEENTR
jgi:uncharacterized DUF497 family protein